MDIDLFKEALQAKGLTPEALAIAAGLSRNTPRRWMEGVQPILGKAQAAVEVLDLTVDRLWPIRRAA